jgi:hypothetical protein
MRGERDGCLLVVQSTWGGGITDQQRRMYDV